MGHNSHKFDDSVGYDRLMGRWSRAVGSVFLEWLAPPREADWLDLGCGTGVFTKLVVDTCDPRAVIAVDSSAVQIDYANNQPAARLANFQVADAEMLPFDNSFFDVVASALTLNFIPDRARAMSEMRRVTRRGGIVAGYVWDFAEELSPSWPLRRCVHLLSSDLPPIPGTADSSSAALALLFEQAGFGEVVSRSIVVTLEYSDFDDFWSAQTPAYSPTTKIIAAMSADQREALKELVKAQLPSRPDGIVEYSARANAVKARN